MCGIVGAVAQRNVATILLEGLKRLEYRGYDSAGISIIDPELALHCLRTVGKVAVLEQAMAGNLALVGNTGIAHTRWATHGKPTQLNAHPQTSGDQVALVHNGIIENHESLRKELLGEHYTFASETDSEIVAHLIHQQLKQGKDLLAAVQQATSRLEGAYALAVASKDDPDRLIAVRSGSPLVVGFGDGEHFIASDSYALIAETQQFAYLEEGDIVELYNDKCTFYDASGQVVQREVHTVESDHGVNDRGEYRHYMLKEIYEQSAALQATLEGRLGKDCILECVFGEEAPAIFERVKQVRIVACGTSFHAALLARYWLESLAGVDCRVEVASEYRYRKKVVRSGSLFVAISQSGETADTLAALRQAKELNYEATLGICNVPESSLVRESDLSFITRAGVEVGVASTKAFTTQLAALMMLTVALGRRFELDSELEASIVDQLRMLPRLTQDILALDESIEALAHSFANKHHALFLGRGEAYPIALEGALKLKELSYIHAEAYPAGELKHGPLALVDEDMPVIAVAPNDQLLEKLKSNLHEVRARGGKLIVFADRNANLQNDEGIQVIEMPVVGAQIMPMAYTLPLQLLAYHVAVIKGTDVDQPRNLAKSVTVE